MLSRLKSTLKPLLFASLLISPTALGAPGAAEVQLDTSEVRAGGTPVGDLIAQEDPRGIALIRVREGKVAGRIPVVGRNITMMAGATTGSHLVVLVDGVEPLL